MGGYSTPYESELETGQKFSPDAFSSKEIIFRLVPLFLGGVGLPLVLAHPLSGTICLILALLLFLASKKNWHLIDYQMPLADCENSRDQNRKPTTYLPPVNTRMKASSHLMALAGTYFCILAPEYMPSIPPTPMRMPRIQSGATAMCG